MGTVDYDIFQDYIFSLIDKGESDDIEFKSAKGGFPKSFWETYSAFANTHGGVIVLGVEERKDHFALNGLDLAHVHRLRDRFWRDVHNRDIVSASLLRSEDVRVEEFEGGCILLFTIPRAPREQKPIFCGRQADDGTFRRYGEGDHRCTIHEVRRMYADSDVAHPADSRILRGFSWDDIDPVSLDQYRTRFRATKPDHPWLSNSNEQLMQSLGGYRRDRETGEEGFTLAGLLMFGKISAIQDVGCAPYFFPDYKEHQHDDQDERWSDRISPDGMWEANLFQFYQRVLPKLYRVVPTPFRLRDGVRQDHTEAHEALREAFVNLCIHADYNEQGSLRVDCYQHQIVFSNPGVMLISKQQFYQGGESVCRNPSLQKMFQMIGAAERAGSGSDKIIRGWKSMGWKQPSPNETYKPNKVELIMPLEAMIDQRTKLELEARLGTHRIASLDNTDLMILVLGLGRETINNACLREVLPIHSADLTPRLRRLSQEGLLISRGYGRGTTYTLATILQAEDATLQANGTILQAEDATLQANDTILQAEDTIQLELLPRRLSAQRLAEAILVFCKDWRSMQEIATHLGRTPIYVRAFILEHMGEALERLYPQKRHPAQKYRARRDE